MRLSRKGETMKRHKIQLPLIFTLVLAASAVSLAGCASAPTIRADVTPGGAALVMKASNFAFDPNMVSVHGTGVVMVTITNTSGTGHNITVDDPKGKVITSVEIPPNATVNAQISFSTPGDYYFFCNHPFHASFGMKGHFIVSGS